MGWYYLPVVLLTSALALVVALLLNNIQRRYPVFWIEPAVPAHAPVSPDLGAPNPTTSQDNSPLETANGNSADTLKAPKQEASSQV
jgi:CBS-domain-containing membrane protein